MESTVAVRARKQSAGRGGLCGLVLCLVLGVMILLPCGCASWGDRPGLTKAEVKRRQKRTLRINYQEMLADIDRTLMLDEPSGLSDKSLP